MSLRGSICHLYKLGLDGHRRRYRPTRRTSCRACSGGCDISLARGPWTLIATGLYGPRRPSRPPRHHGRAAHGNHVHPRHFERCSKNKGTRNALQYAVKIKYRLLAYTGNGRALVRHNSPHTCTRLCRAALLLGLIYICIVKSNVKNLQMVLFGTNLVRNISTTAPIKAKYSMPNLHFFGANKEHI